MGPRYILIVEDDLVINQIMTAFIHQKGWNVITCCNLADAQQEIHQVGIELILLDYYLPDGTALSMLDTLKKYRPSVPVIVISGDNEPQTILSCFKSGALDYIIKPVNLELFWHKVEGLLARFSLEKKVKKQHNILEKLLLEKSHEEQIARRLFDHFIEINSVGYEFVKSFTQSSTSFSGDVVVNAIAPNGNFFLMIADSTGHGLSAAMPILRVVNTFRAMVAKGFDLITLVSEINTNIYHEIPGDRFVAAVVVEVNFNRNQVFIWNAGMPDALLQLENNESRTVSSHTTNDLVHYKSKNLALGIMSPDAFSANVEVIDLPMAGCLCLMSDGLIEHKTKDGAFLGMEGVISLLSLYGKDLTDYMRETLNRQFFDDIKDDVAICVLDFDLLHQWYQHRPAEFCIGCNKGEFTWHINMSGPMLIGAEYLNSLNHFLKIFGFPTTFSQKVFTVVSELFTNAVDYGVLKLNPELKNDIEGFDVFHNLRERSASQITMKDWVEVELQWYCLASELHITVSDSGEGYCPKPTSELTDVLQLSGRGLNLVRSLCKRYEWIAPGNITKVIMEL
ncbi:fused response regulator/phosphatase [Shewanella acanthi]|uniref:fused response regulator/phosphatase n=1 Tax=Shewanella acanthi TaxID=2864212 RepID=UPI001C655208|nr:fused response regulator/phosphatase [Shewanella acanthi]QYJ80377.1 fused response regulator/phosphatase [Shewanella acanthi]